MAASSTQSLAALRTAMALAGGGEKHVLLVDAALADKHLTAGFAAAAEFGLSEVLKGRIPWQQAVRATSTSGLCLLPAGRLAPPRLTDDDTRLKDLLKELTSQWDLVIIDGGCAGDPAAGAVMAAAQNVYLIARLGETHLDAAEAAIDIVEKSEATMRGCVVTNV